MTTDPNFPPPGDIPPPRPHQPNAPNVKAAAIAMIIYNGLSVVGGIASALTMTAMRAWMHELAKNQPELNEMDKVFDNPLYNLLNIGGAALAAVALLGSFLMLRKKAYPLALAGAVITMINPGGCCCCLIGTGIGIWALVGLLNEQTKADFRDV